MSAPDRYYPHDDDPDWFAPDDDFVMDAWLDTFDDEYVGTHSDDDGYAITWLGDEPITDDN